MVVARHRGDDFLSTNPTISVPESDRPEYTLASDRASSTFDLSDAYLR